MKMFYRSKRLDFQSGGDPIVVIREKEAENQGIMPGDKVFLQWNKKKSIVAIVQYTNSKVNFGEVGLFKEIWQKKDIIDGDVAKVALESRPESIKAINKKLLGHNLSYDETYSIMADISSGKLGKIETTYYVASGFAKAYTMLELYYMTRAMAMCGEMINSKIKVVDKHSIGGIPGNRTTMIVIPIIASLGLYIPKASSRAITSPSGTADTMEVLAPVEHPVKKINEIVRKTHACLVWGGGVNLAPADDKIIRIEKRLSLETHDKMIVSIMAKKVAMGVDYLIIDLPYGETAKVHSLKIAQKIAKKFVSLGKMFNIKVKVITTQAKEPIGAGIGPALEARDVLRVLQRHELRPLDLERKAVLLAGKLLELKKFCRRGHGKKIAEKQLLVGAAWEKMSEIIKAQGGCSTIKADEVAIGALHYEIHAKKSGRIVHLDNRAINEICVNLGAPHDKVSGIHMHCRLYDKINKGAKLYTLYAESQGRLDLGRLAAKNNTVADIK